MVSDFTPLQQVIRAIVFCLLVLPVVPIGISWYRVVSSPIGGAPSRTRGLVLLIIVTCSQAFLMLGLVASDAVFGPVFSSRRFATIFAWVLRAHVGRVLVVSCTWVTCSWFYAVVVSSTV